MANNLIQIKRTSVSGRAANTTTLPNPGELALNMTDGILYSTNGSAVFEIGANNTNSRVTNNLTVGNTVTATGIVSGSELTSTNASGDEGGQINLAKPPNATTAGGVTIDAYQDKVRIFEQGGNARGVYIDLTACANGVGTNLLAGGGGGGSVNTSAQYTWSNTQTFQANVAFTGNNISLVSNTGSVMFAGSGDTNWRIGRSTGSFTKSFYTNNTLDFIAANSNLEGIAFGFTGDSVYFETGYAGTFTKNPIYVGNSTVNVSINSTAFSGTANNATNAFGKTEGNLNVNSALTANSSTYLGGNTASDLRSYSDTVSGTAYSNAATYADNKAANAYSNAITFAANASNANNGTLAEARLPYRMNQNVRTSDSVEFTNMTLTGNLVVNGGVVTLTGNSVTFTDNMIYLNQGVSANITNITANGTYIVFTANNNYQVGWDVTVTGVDPSAYNGTYLNIYAANSTTFTVANTTTGSYVSGGTARGKTESNPDVGIVAGYNDGTYHHAGIFRDASDGVWKVFDGYDPEPDTSVYIDTANASFRIADFQANLVTAANINSPGLTNTATLNVTTTANLAAQYSNTTGFYPTSNTVGQALGNTTARWAIVGSTVSLSSTFSVSGAASFGAALNFNGTTTNINATALTTGTINLGGASQTGAINIGRSTANQTLALANGITANGSVKTIEIGTLGDVLSNTIITLGSSTGGGLTTIQTPNTYFPSNVSFAGTAYLSGIYANGSLGTAGHVLHSNGTSVYWAADDQGVTSVTAGNGLTGNITSTGTIAVLANSGIISNSTGVFVDSAYIATLAANSATWLGSVTSGNSTGIYTTGNVGIGIVPSSTASLYINESITLDSAAYGQLTTITDSNTSMTAARNKFTNYNRTVSRNQNKSSDGLTTYNSGYYGFTSEVWNGDSSVGGDAFANLMEGVRGAVVQYANGTTSNTISTARGVYGAVQVSGTGIITNAYGLQGVITAGNNSVSGNVTTAYGVLSQVQSNTAMTIGTGYLYYGAHTGSTTTTKYGVYLTGESINYFSGNVGIGNSAPTEKLQIQGNIQLQNGAATANTSRNAGIRFWTDNAFGAELHYGDTGSGQSNSWATALYGRKTDTVAVRIGAYPGSNTSQNTFSEYVTILNSGNFGIGTTTPGQKLTVSGTANITGVTTFGANVSGPGTTAYLDGFFIDCGTYT